MSFSAQFPNHSLAFTSPESAFALVTDGATIVTAMAACEPTLFYREAHHLVRQRNNLTIYCANPNEAFPIFDDQSLLGNVELRPMFLTTTVRHHQKRQHVHYVPMHLSQWVQNLLNQNNVDVFWGSCSVPDSRGFVSLGPNVCYEYEVIKAAKHVVLEVNPNIPFTYGATCIPITRVDAFIESREAVPTYKTQKADAVDRQIAEYVADLVPNGATLQFGIGSIPNAMGEALAHKKDLGIHTEMINDTGMKLYQAGIVTGRKKTIWPDKIVGTFAYGSAELYRFLHQNPMVELHPASVINDPYRIGRNHKMTSINTAIEVDLTGQVCSESVGHLELSGVGGATDTHVGAQRSPGGRGVIAVKSLTKDGFSKITDELRPGAKVSINRNDIDTVVTEHGVAQLRGKTVSQRAQALIRIAHPDKRRGLIKKAREHGYF